jgi:hypothetical protein
MANERTAKTHFLHNIDLKSILEPAEPAPHIAGTKGSPYAEEASQIFLLQINVRH